MRRRAPNPCRRAGSGRRKAGQSFPVHSRFDRKGNRRRNRLPVQPDRHTTEGLSQGIAWSLVNYGEGSFTGAQLATVNYVKGDVEGFQWSVVNVAGSVNGLQLGLVNSAQTMHGIQIGLINIIKQDGFMPVFPIVNWSF